MRRPASSLRLILLCGPILLLSGCGDFGDFLGDTATLGTNPNHPVGDSLTMRRVDGLDTATAPLLPEPGDVWPGPVQAPPTLQDLEKNPAFGTTGGEPTTTLPPALENAPDHRQPRPVYPPGSSTPPGNVEPGLEPLPAPGVPSTSAAPPSGSRAGQVVVPPTGSPGVTTGGGPGYQTLTTPEGSGIIVPNGNGTSTLIRPDGTVQTIPGAR